MSRSRPACSASPSSAGEKSHTRCLVQMYAKTENSILNKWVHTVGNLFVFPNMKIFEHRKFKRVIKCDHPYTWLLDSRIVDFVLYHIFHLSIHQSVLFIIFVYFKASCRHQWPSCFNTSTWITLSSGFLCSVMCTSSAY